MSRRTPALRRVVIFGTVAGLGLVLAWLLGGQRGERMPDGGATIEVVDVPAGTPVAGDRHIPGVQLMRAIEFEVAPVREVLLDDGTRIPFRSLRLAGAAEHPLPSSDPAIQRIGIDEPVVLLLREPETRADLEGDPAARASRFEAPRGVLERSAEGEGFLRLEGGVVATTVREGTPWTFAAETAEVDLRSRRLVAPGAVAVTSRGLAIEGRDLEAADVERTIELASGARGTVHDPGGTDLGTGNEGRAVDFACTGAFRVLPLPAEADGRERVLIRLEREARVAQGTARLEADTIDIRVARSRDADDTARPEIEQVLARGTVRFLGDATARAIRATADELLARPAGDGRTEVLLRGSPALTLVETPPDGGGDRTLTATGRGVGRFVLPRGAGPVDATLDGGTTATWSSVTPGDPDRRLAARRFDLTAARDAAGATAWKRLRAEGDVELVEGERIVRATTLTHVPTEGGGSELDLQGDVSIRWPATGAVDPVATLSDPAAPASGTLWLDAPDHVRLTLPPPDAAAGPRVAIRGGAILRRMADEREVYRLEARSLDADLEPTTRRLQRLVADGAVTFAGRGEGRGERRYDLRGERLVLDASTADDTGGTLRVEGQPAVAFMQSEDGRPFRLESPRLDFDRATGDFNAVDGVRAEGLLPEGGTLGAGTVTLRADRLAGRFAPGGATGSSRLLAAVAEGSVRVDGEGDRASGDRLAWNADDGGVLLRGAPARLRVATRLPGTEFADEAVAPVLRLRLAEGRIAEARAEQGGTLVRHRRPPSDPGAPDRPAPVERLTASGTGVLVHRRGESVLEQAVSLRRDVFEDGSWVLRDRLDDVDELRILHPADPVTGRPGLTTAIATSAAGKMRIESGGGAWKGFDIARIELDVAAGRVTLTASNRAPRFRVEHSSGTQWYRRVVYDTNDRLFVEQVGASLKGR